MEPTGPQAQIAAVLITALRDPDIYFLFSNVASLTASNPMQSQICHLKTRAQIQISCSESRTRLISSTFPSGHSSPGAFVWLVPLLSRSDAPFAIGAAI